MTLTTTRQSARRSALRAGACVAVLASGALLLTACSSSGSSGSASADAKASSSSSPSSSAKGASGGAQDMAAYRDCLSQHGVKLPSFSGRPSDRASGRPSGRPSGGFGGGSGGFGGFGGESADPATQKAMEACASLRPQFNGQRGGGPGGDSSAFQAFTSCLKDHGVTLPTPSPTTRRGGFGFGFGDLNTSDPKTAKAYTTCKPLLPTRPPASPSAT
ncbi:hypothetical protein [Streptomyces sp. NPDC088910]|uniref:hypothetical protein n=1 Tax=Streptomyces sp. NPDC088910 TaxID=3365911 RepID=UPI00380523BE